MLTDFTKKSDYLIFLFHLRCFFHKKAPSLKSVVIPVNNTCKIIYTGTKLPSKFNIKDEISKKHKHDSNL